jgi:hypothetical protein
LILETGTKWLKEFCKKSKALERLAPSVLNNLASISDVAILSEFRSRLYEQFNDFDCWLEKIIHNHFIFKDFPLNNRFGTYEDYFYGILGSYFFVKFVVTCYMADKVEKNDLTDVFSLLFRLINHTNFEFNAFVLLKQAGLNSLKKINKLLL